MQFKFASCHCITNDMVAALREDPTGLSPCVAACLRCMPVTCRGVPVDTINQPPLNPEPGTTIGQLLTDDWCTANGMIRGHTPKGTATLLVVQPTARQRFILRATPSRRYILWDDPANQERVQHDLAELPSGTDYAVVGDSVYTVYVVRAVGSKLCVLNPDSSTDWTERQIHPNDQLVVFGNENIYGDLARGAQLRTAETPIVHDDLFLQQRDGLARGRISLGVQRVLRLR